MNWLSLETLKCTSFPSYGPLPHRLEVRIDGAAVREPYSLQTAIMAVGAKVDVAHPFSRSYVFEDSLTVSLVPGGPQVDIPDLTLDGALESGYAIHTFSRGAFQFELEYTVATDVDVDPIRAAIEEFRDGRETAESSEFHGWSELDHETVVDRIEEIATWEDENEDDENVFQIAQESTPWCGPASVAFALAYRHPRRFVEVARSLYETGTVIGRTDSHRISSNLRAVRAHADVHDGDWLLLASLIHLFASPYSLPNEADFVDIDLGAIDEPTYTLEVTYWDEDFDPVEGGVVLLECTDEPGVFNPVLELFDNGFEPITFVGATDEDGRVTVDLPDGEYTIKIKHPSTLAYNEGSVEIDGEGTELLEILETSNHFSGYVMRNVRDTLEEIAGFDDVAMVSSTDLTERRQQFDDGSTIVDGGGVSVLRLDAGLIPDEDDEGDEPPEEGDDGWFTDGTIDRPHAVVMDAPYTVVGPAGTDGDEDVIEFTCHTWGRRARVRNTWNQIGLVSNMSVNGE